ncbi:C40 family peptidase [Bacillus sp. T33-2]|uniref:C40 family peptidase n=1 Tax=Bacillus sp. T33-2 TaxID=2054168 RepID=UPI000C794E98|nr:C40 family peptidase [Bacillus sp. T33-2]PLR95206.1 peptidase [Bacillus sp. T33-2]
MESNNIWLVNVPVATVWTSYDSPRQLDEPAITNPADMEAWLKGMTHEAQLGLCNDNLVQTQVLFGQPLLIIDEKDDWAKVLIPGQPSSKDERGYPGWLPKIQLLQQSEWYVKEGPVAVVTSTKAELYHEDDKLMLELSFLTALPVIEELDDQVRVKIPSGTGRLKMKDITVYPSPNIRKGDGADIVSAGEKFIGLPYLWGGMSSFGYDCSGFSHSMYKANGCTIPRDAHDQAQAGKEVDLNSLKPGDLLFFAYKEGKGRIHHVAIYYGNGKMLHSPNTGKTIEIISLEGTIYEKELCAARRYWQDAEE